MTHSDLMETLKFALVAVSVVAVVQAFFCAIAGNYKE